MSDYSAYTQNFNSFLEFQIRCATDLDFVLRLPLELREPPHTLAFLDFCKKSNTEPESESPNYHNPGDHHLSQTDPCPKGPDAPNTAESPATPELTASTPPPILWPVATEPPATSPETPPKRKRGRPPGSKNKPKLPGEKRTVKPLYDSAKQAKWEAELRHFLSKKAFPCRQGHDGSAETLSVICGAFRRHCGATKVTHKPFVEIMTTWATQLPEPWLIEARCAAADSWWRKVALASLDVFATLITGSDREGNKLSFSQEIQMFLTVSLVELWHYLRVHDTASARWWHDVIDRECQKNPSNAFEQCRRDLAMNSRRLGAFLRETLTTHFSEQFGRIQTLHHRRAILEGRIAKLETPEPPIADVPLPSPAVVPASAIVDSGLTRFSLRPPTSPATSPAMEPATSPFVVHDPATIFGLTGLFSETGTAGELENNPVRPSTPAPSVSQFSTDASQTAAENKPFCLPLRPVIRIPTRPATQIPIRPAMSPFELMENPIIPSAAPWGGIGRSVENATEVTEVAALIDKGKEQARETTPSEAPYVVQHWHPSEPARFAHNLYYYDQLREHMGEAITSERTPDGSPNLLNMAVYRHVTQSSFLTIRDYAISWFTDARWNERSAQIKPGASAKLAAFNEGKTKAFREFVQSRFPHLACASSLGLAIDLVRNDESLKNKTALLRECRNTMPVGEDFRKWAESQPDNIKRSLPSITPSGWLLVHKEDNKSYFNPCSRRIVDDWMLVNGLVCADIDGLYGDSLPQTKAKLIDSGLCSMIATSARGRGLFAIVRYNRNRYRGIDGFNEARERIWELLRRMGLSPDISCKNVSRRRFLAYDPDAWIDESNTAQLSDE